MKNKWKTLFKGQVKLIITGQGVERFINDCTRKGIDLSTIQIIKENQYSLWMEYEKVSKLRPLVRKHGVKIAFKNRRGFPFLLFKLNNYKGFVLGFLSFFIILFGLSNMVWGIKIVGADPKTEYIIFQELDEIGIRKGKFLFTLDDVETIQRKLTDNIEVITWVGVELRGTTYHLQVVEKTQPEQPEIFGPQHIIARKKAVITDMFIEQGVPQVSLYDSVEKGQILVSGLIGREDNLKAVAAKGNIFGETWYKSTVAVPLQSSFQLLTGNSEKRFSFTIGKLTIPIWGFGNPGYDHFQVDENAYQANIVSYRLPIFFNKNIIHEIELYNRQYTRDEAVKEAIIIGKKKLEAELGDDAQIIGEKVLREVVKNGKVNVDLHFQVIEDIVQLQPINQGD